MAISKLEFGRGHDLFDYWAKGLGKARWVTSPTPWTTLRDLLIAAGVPAREAPGLATNVMQSTPEGRAAFNLHHKK